MSNRIRDLQDKCRMTDGRMNVAKYEQERTNLVNEIGGFDQLTPEERASYWGYLVVDLAFDVTHQRMKKMLESPEPKIEISPGAKVVFVNRGSGITREMVSIWTLNSIVCTIFNVLSILLLGAIVIGFLK